MTYTNGDKYEGHWENGLYHGLGRLTLKNGTVYECDFKYGKKCGKGIIKFPN